MNVQRLKTGKDGVLPALKKDAEYAVIEVTEGLKFDVQPVATFSDTTRQLATFEEILPLPTKAHAKGESVSTAKPQGE